MVNYPVIFPVINPVAIGLRIKLERKRLCLTVDQLREFLGLESEQAIYKWQRGDSVPTVDNLYALSVLFGTTIDYLICGEREEPEMDSSHQFVA